MKKKLIGILTTIALAVTMCLALAACGSTGTSVKHYDGKYAEIIGSYIPISEVYDSGDNYLELKGDKNISLVLNSDEITGLYTIDGENIKFTIKDNSIDYDLNGTIKDGIIENNFLDMSNLVFAENGADLSKYTSK